MPWQARFVDAVDRDGEIAYSIAYTDGTVRITREYRTSSSITQASLSAVARAEIAKLSAAAKARIEITVPPRSLIDLSEPIAPKPTDAEIARAELLRDIAAEEQARRRAARIAALSPELQARIAELRLEEQI